MTRSQLERERVTEFAMQLKKLFKQAYPAYRCWNSKDTTVHHSHVWYIYCTLLLYLYGQCVLDGG